ncbi:peptidase M15B and M15C [Amycolatopsis rubida]|uniref:Peptidase M15B and M15C n=1 Tax=Amycolatopsis rubida TaxID=112413 RepID=A0ABX0BJS5_9PSEU|nr:M15 family metallopeptidase [Amycolatopsis sp. M39]MYW90142.1 peptidase M15B and M15C [Amycolatopsis rubida]NEC55119.1 peptidase M15B and M15C [Amycolatopsis rubida]OAP28595.1 D-alanyl-D-alanine carboxypeptidase [Amycolatopsis sp. M39]
MLRNKVKPVLLALPAVVVAGCSGLPALDGDPDHDPAQGGAPEGVTLTPFDTSYPAVGNLDPALRKALQEAATDARQRKVDMHIASGWRTKEYQQKLLDGGIEKYGSLEEARKFVNTPEKSTHVSGKAVDVAPTRAADWLIQHGEKYGLCQVYANEMWHFELLTTPGGTCPPARTDAAG